MSIISDTPVSVPCPHCGLRGSGRFCSSCGSALNPADETVSREIGSKLTNLTTTTLLPFLKATWLVLRMPRQFFTSYVTATPPLSELSFPLAGVWRRLAPGRQRVMQPFQSLALAVGLVAGVAGLQESARQTAFIAPTPADQRQAEREQSLQASYEQRFGRPLLIVRKARLTGWSVIDRPAHEFIRLFEAIYFPLVVLLFLRHRNVDRHVLLHYYVYALAAALTIIAVCEVLGAAGMLALVHTSWELLALVLVMMPPLVGFLARAYFVVLLPIVVFPRVLPVTRLRVISATAVGALVWGAANEIVRRMLLAFEVMWM
jgi:hypothetical protein